MAEREVFSPNNAVKGHPRDSNRRGEELTQARVYRGDGHLANHVGKNARTNPRLRADFGETNEPMQGGRRNVIE